MLRETRCSDMMLPDPSLLQSRRESVRAALRTARRAKEAKSKSDWKSQA